MNRAIDFWLLSDATVRFTLLRIFYPLFSLRTLIALINRIPLVRYQRLQANRREKIFTHLVKLSRKYGSRMPMVHALALYWMNARSHLAIGVSQNELSLAGHAWVECDTQVLSTLETAGYSRLVRYGARGELIF